MSESIHIAADVVNHDTAGYTELKLRSLYAQDLKRIRLTNTIYDNGSQADLLDLVRYAESVNVPIVQSGFTTETKNNSHGEVLNQFVVANTDCTHHLFLDTDVCFIEVDTVTTMEAELSARTNAFGIGARMSWDGVDEIPESIREENEELYQ